jgi:hypothetical protein
MTRRATIGPILLLGAAGLIACAPPPARVTPVASAAPSAPPTPPSIPVPPPSRGRTMGGCDLDHADQPRTLTQAVRCRVPEAVRRFVEVEHIDPNRLEEGLTALQATLLAHEVFSHHGRDTRSGGNGAPPGMYDIARYLLRHGADPRLPTRYGGVRGYTLLHHVAYDGKMGFVRMLVEAGADVNARDARGYTPLHAAARCDFRLSYDLWAAETIQYLVDHGADITVRGDDGVTVLGRVPVPCAQPGRCTRAELTRRWATGHCKQTYLAVKQALDRAARQRRTH